MIFKIICVPVLWTKVALALEGLGLRLPLSYGVVLCLYPICVCQDVPHGHRPTDAETGFMLYEALLLSCY